MTIQIPQVTLKYAVAIVLVIMVMLLKSVTEVLFGGGPPLVLFLGAVIIASWYGGFGPGLVATLVSAFVCLYFYFDPPGSFRIQSWNDAFRLGVFVLEGAGLSLLMNSLHAARRRAEETTRHLQAKDQALREGEERYHELVDSVQDYAIIMLDPRGHVISWNAGAERIKGYRANEIIGRHFSAFYRPADSADGALDRVLNSVAAGQRFESEGWRVRKDGSTFWANVVITAVRNDAGELKGFSKVTRDITLRHKQEEDLRRASLELSQARDQALEASRAKSEFLANMSHEIRTPMNGVLGMTELVLDTELTPEQRESLELVRTSAESLLIVINDILDFSKIEAGKLELDLVEFDVHDMIEDTLKTLALRAHRKGLELTSDIDAGVPRDAVGDPHRLRQILVNLVGNAIKFTERGEVVVRTRLHRQLNDGCQVEISVQDTGIGIPADKQQAIFDPFAQADSSMTRRHSGTGLGLTIASRLVALMGGRLEVDSKIGLGSTFRFCVNMANPAGSAAKHLEHAKIDLQGLSILVVDDNETNRRIFDGLLRRWGARPTSVESGPAAIAELHRAADQGTPYPLVLVDAMMPDMDGFMLIERVRHEAGLNLPAIMMLTSADQQGDATRCRSLGVQSYLVKPIKSDDLRQAIITALSAQLDHAKKATVAQSAPKVPAGSVPGRSLRVLLAEDNDVNQQVAVRFLEKLGHKVVVVEDGKRALEEAVRGDFDLILMDIQMPEMNGLETTEAIRAAEAGMARHTPIVAMTAHAMKGDRERCLAAGMDDYISKPIQSAELVRVTQQLQGSWAGDRKVAPSMSPRAETCPMDYAAALEHVDGDEKFLAQLIRLFADKLPQRIDEIQNALADNDLARVARSTHSLRGAAGTLAAEPFTAAALRLENCAERGDAAGVTISWAEFEREVTRLSASLAATPAVDLVAEHAV